MTILKTIIFISLVGLGYPHAYGIIRQNTNAVLPYTPTPGLLENLPAQDGSPAIAVPILLYHGVVETPDNDNTSRDMFIKQMEKLKSAGYQTITLSQLEQFYDGDFTLPPKPIMITFDDGRKDSFYPTDEIFQKLGYTAVLFEASGPTLNGDKFFLDWGELANVRDTGRWDIGAHGRLSHQHIIINNQGAVGRYLSSLIYDPMTGLESVQDFEKRVEKDYLDGIADLKNNLGITTDAFAVPFNDYGQQPNSNYPEATSFNKKLIKKYFHMAFIESLTYDPKQINDYNNPQIHWNLYNYQNDDPLSSVRLEPKEMNPDLLLSLLERFKPKNSDLSLDYQDPTAFKNYADVQYAEISSDGKGLHIRPGSDGTAARITIGDTHWQNYSVETDITRVAGKSSVLQVYAKDQYHLIAIGFSYNGVYLHEINGETENDEISISPEQNIGLHDGQEYHVNVIVQDQKITVSVDDIILFNEIPINIDRGAVGFKIWDPLPMHAHTVVKSLRIKPLINN